MNNDLFQQAKTAAAAKDFGQALNLYTSCLQDQKSPLAPGEAGLIYHQIGNCLTKLKNNAEAVTAYTQAAADTAYDACGTVNYNLGMSYAALHDYDNAVKHFEIAVSDAKYNTPYKAYMGMGNVLMKQGKSAQAGVAFREAALDEANTDPTKALLNLGVCFMALDRPADAVASYESALQFDMRSDVRNKMYASLGQAYVACGEMQQAVDAFEKAIADKSYFLSASASVDYQRAIAVVSQGSGDKTQALPPVAADTSGIDVVTDDLSATSTGMFPVSESPEEMSADNAYYYADVYGEDHDPEQVDDMFFNSSDEELEQWSKGLAKKGRKRRSVGLKILVVIITLLVVLAAAGVALYALGFGYPQQETVVQQVFNNPSNASSNFASSLQSSDVSSMTALIPSGGTATVDGVNKSMSTSTAYVTVTTNGGGSQQYQVELVREGIGWKVSDIELYFASRN